MAKAAKLLAFLLQSISLGLAVAFLVVLIKPDLLLSGPPPPPVNMMDLLIDAVDRSADSVVNIYTIRVINEAGNGRPDEPPSFRRDLGSGVIIDEAGYVVTNRHVVAGAEAIRVQLADGRVADPVVVSTDPDTDLALLRIALSDLPTIRWGRSDTLRRGELVLAIGNPFGLGQTVTQGIVSATGRGQLGVSTFEDFIQTDAAINLGNSGGALVNSNGELIGINTAVLDNRVLPEGIGFAIPVNLVRGVITQLIENGRVIRGWLGVTPWNLSPQRAALLNIPPGIGIEVIGVCTGSPAHLAGLRIGDIITAINNERIEVGHEALNLVAGMAPGTPISLTGYRQPGDTQAPSQPTARAFELRTQVQERPLIAPNCQDNP